MNFKVGKGRKRKRNERKRTRTEGTERTQDK